MPIAELGVYDGAHWTTVTVDNRVRGNAYYRSDGDAAAYFTRKITLGPKGSIWGCAMSWAEAPDAGIALVQLASVASPNPNRGGVDDEGTLTDDPLTYLNVRQDDTYAAAFLDAPSSGFIPFRMTGDDGAPLTTMTAGVDPYTGYNEMDGGAGVYEVKVKVNGKNAASAGYVLRLTGLVFFRIDDLGFM